MAIRTLSESLDNLYTTTWQHMKETVRDQIFDATPFWFFLKEKGRLKPENGGRYITDPLQYAKNDNIQWITKGGTVPLNDTEILTTSKWDWKYLTGSLVRFGVDDQQNRGKQQIINFMNAKLENTKNALASDLETKLFAAAAAGNEFDGLQRLVADDPTASVSVGDINQSTYSWWRNKFKDMASSSFASNGAAEMRTILNNVSNNLGMDKTDIIISGQTPYEWYEDAVLDNYYRTYDTKMADMGFENQKFKGIPWVWSPSCANTRMYFLNTNFITLRYDPAMNFDMTKWKDIPDQVNDRAAQIIFACSLTVSRRRCQGVIFGIDTA